MINEIENTYLKVIRGEGTGFCANLIKFFLHPFSWVYALIIYIRNKAYDLGLFKENALTSQTVISIGNITVGGSGKTPVTMMLSRDISAHVKTAIVTRGYRSEAEDLKTPLVLSCGLGPEFPAQLSGDEAYMLADNLPHTTVCVGKDRFQAAQVAADLGADVIILDDGMQHRKLSRDFEVVVMDATDPFGQGYYLPRGLLRDDIRSLKRADLIILNNTTSPEQYETVKETLKRYSEAPVVGTYIASTTLHDLDGLPVKQRINNKVGMFCAIAKPDNFLHTLEKFGLEVVGELRFGDHRPIDEEQLRHFSDYCKQLDAEYLVCTEKDKVKISKNIECSLPVIWAKIELKICEGSDHWKGFLEKAEEKIKAKRELIH